MRRAAARRQVFFGLALFFKAEKPFVASDGCDRNH
jgi:hypothetical protein